MNGVDVLVALYLTAWRMIDLVEVAPSKQHLPARSE